MNNNSTGGFCVFTAVGEEESNVNKLVEMTEERTAALVPMETTSMSSAGQQHLMQAQQNGPMGINEGAGLQEEDNSSEEDS